MNENLNKLSIRATISEKDRFEYFDKQKFAELIVKECASIYDKIDNGNSHMGTHYYPEAIYKHFGVE